MSERVGAAVRFGAGPGHSFLGTAMRSGVRPGRSFLGTARSFLGTAHSFLGTASERTAAQRRATERIVAQ
jgi:hypothetical protein